MSRKTCNWESIPKKELSLRVSSFSVPKLVPRIFVLVMVKLLRLFDLNGFI